MSDNDNTVLIDYLLDRVEPIIEKGGTVTVTVHAPSLCASGCPVHGKQG